MAATAAAGNGKVVRWQHLAFANLGALLGNFSSVWLFLAPLLASSAYAPRRLFQTYFNLFLRRHARRLLAVVDPYVTVDIAEPGADAQYVSRVVRAVATDHTYEEVKAYLSTKCSAEARELLAEGAAEGDGLVLSTRDGQDVADEFKGVTLWWSLVMDEHGARQGVGNQASRRSQRLTFHQRHRRLVVDEYLPHVRRQGREILFHNRRRRLYTNNKTPGFSSIYPKSWSYINFDHPTTFETLAMDSARKKEIMSDLDAFQSNRDFYRRTGKPWKRGYLLYGQPGTGKSTMIAAMANYLDYDIYDVELTVVSDNNDLRKLLIETTSKSIIVIEDIDCSLDLTGDRATQRPVYQHPRDDRRRNSVTLSGLLNFIDGLWSASGGERIVVFTTNHVDKLDPALIRCGRMDMHIEMSYCCAEAFRTLAKNYLDIDAHHLFDAVDEILNKESITPADVAESLMAAKRACSDVTSCLGILVDELKKRVEEKAKADAEAMAKAEAEAKERAEAEPNHLDIDAHHMFDAVEEVLRKVELAPAHVAKCLMTAKRAGSDESSCFETMIDELKKRAEEKAKAEAEAKAQQEAEAEAAAKAEAEEAKAQAQAEAKATADAEAKTDSGEVQGSGEDGQESADR